MFYGGTRKTGVSEICAFSRTEKHPRHHSARSVTRVASSTGYCRHCALAGIVSTATRIGFWPAFLIALFAMVANGVLTEYEDNLPGGLNNPRPPDDPRT